MPNPYADIEKAISIDKENGGRTGQLGRAIDGVVTVNVPGHPELYYVRYFDGSWVKAYHNGLIPSTKKNYFVDTKERWGRKGQMETYIESVRHDLNPDAEEGFLTFQDEGISLPQRQFVNFVGEAVTATDNGTAIVVTVTATSSETTIDLRQDPLNPCKLQKFEDGAWVDFANLRLCVPLLRRSPTTGRIEYSTDGTTWVEYEDSPVPSREETGSDAWCYATKNALAVIIAIHQEAKRLHDEGLSNLLIGSKIASLLELLIIFPQSAAAITTLLTEASSVLSSILITDFDGAVQDELECILYCNAQQDVDGVVTFDYANVIGQIESNVGDIWQAISYYLQVLTEDGLNRAGATTSVTTASCFCEDCAECNNYYDPMTGELGAQTFLWYVPTSGAAIDKLTTQGNFRTDIGRLTNGCIEGTSHAPTSTIRLCATIDLGIGCTLTNWYFYHRGSGGRTMIVFLRDASNGFISTPVNTYGSAPGSWTLYEQTGLSVPNVRYICVLLDVGVGGQVYLDDFGVGVAP